MRVVGSSVLTSCVSVRWLWRWFFLAGGVVGRGCVAGAGGAFRSFSLALNLFGGTPKRACGTRALLGMLRFRSGWGGVLGQSPDR